MLVLINFKKIYLWDFTNHLQKIKIEKHVKTARNNTNGSIL